ncbi:MAG: CotH kinase family protein [Desulfovibrio sp.]|jgi:hypothetical protein|nr:CotH kinase family protein [Desulfovibrio sp.]
MRKLVVVLFIAVCSACAALSFISPPDVPASRPVSRVHSSREGIGHTVRDEKETALAPYFSPPGHFYAETTAVSIHSRLPDARIHYTTDGSDPTESSARYSRPLTLEPKEGANCVVLKAVAVSGRRASPVVTHSYFLDGDIKNRFSSYVFSLSTDDRNLHDHERGILVPGKRRAESVALHPDRGEQAHDANYKGRGREWERPVYVEAFTPDGARIVAQKAGLRVFGGVTRHFAQKSLRLVARKFYEPKSGKFDYPFFPELADEKARLPALSYDSLVLRNGGQDLEDAQMRTALNARIAANAGYPYVAPVRSAAVYINGKYYGHAFLTVRIDDSFLADLYDAPRDDFIIFAGGVKELRSSPKYPELLHWRIIRKFSELTRDCEKKEMDEALYDAVRQQMDIDNLLLYYALEIYMDNRDWPDDQNNTRVWRYYGDSGASSAELDGRWRYILYDLDATAMSPWHGAKPPSNPTLRRVLKESPLFGTLMKRPDLAGKFANHLCDMAFVHFAEPNVTKVMDALNGESMREIQFAARHGVYSPPGLPETIARGRENVLAFFRERPGHVLRELRDLFGYTGLYRVVVDGPAKINTAASQGWYFVENPVIVTPALPRGMAMRHWEVNGEARVGQHLELAARDAVNGVIRVKLVTDEKPFPLVFEAAYDRGGVCGFSIRNISGEARSARDLYLSDKLDKPRKWPMAGIDFAPGELLDFVGKGYRHPDALLKLKVNFNPRRGETVYLRDKSGAIMSSIAVR